LALRLGTSRSYPGRMFTRSAWARLAERYSYVFEGNSQVLDQILFSPNLVDHFPHVYDVVHVNSEFADALQASDHEPSVVRLDLRGRPAP
jgi:predicted extracellular nuclease